MEIIAYFIVAFAVSLFVFGLVFDPEFPLLSGAFGVMILLFIASVAFSAIEYNGKVKQFEKKCVEANKGVRVSEFCIKKDAVIERMK